MRRTLTILVVVLLLVPTPAAAAVEPNFETTVPEPTLTPGATTTVTVQLGNDAADPDERVETAEEVRVVVTGGDTPFEVRSGPRLLGTMRDGDVREFAVRVDVPADVPAGSYDLRVAVTYVDDGERVNATVNATVRVRERARFAVDDVTSNVAVGESGTVTVSVTNLGERAASAAALTLSSDNPAVEVAGARSASRYAGDWAPGETRTLTFDVSVDDSAEPGTYALRAVVEYDDADGVPGQSRPLRLGVSAAPEQSFAVRNVTSTLRVGDDGRLRGELVNTGDRPVESVVVVFEPDNPNVEPVETEVAVGDLGPGERAAFAFEAAVSDAAGAGDRQFSVTVRYRTGDGDRRSSEPVDVVVAVGERRDDFGLSGVETTVQRGENGGLTVEVTNRRDGPVTDLSAKLYAKSPLSTDDDEAFVPSLAPGESATLTFGLGVGSDALAKTYPVKLDFRYETADGETRITDTYQLPVTVTEPETNGPGPLVLGGAVVVLGALGGVAYLLRR